LDYIIITKGIKFSFIILPTSAKLSFPCNKGIFTNGVNFFIDRNSEIPKTVNSRFSLRKINSSYIETRRITSNHRLYKADGRVHSVIFAENLPDQQAQTQKVNFCMKVQRTNQRSYNILHKETIKKKLYFFF